MQNTMSDMRAKYALFGIMVFIVGFVSAMYLTPSVTSTQAMAITPSILGHIVFTVTDADGNLIHYQQTDNVVTDKGNECALRNLLGTMTTSNGVAKCPAPDTAKTFNKIAFGDGAGVAVVADTDLKGTQTGIAVADTQDWDVGLEKAVLKLKCTVDAAVGSCDLKAGEKVSETALYDDILGKPGGKNMLARQALNSITLTKDDVLNTVWTLDTDNK